MSGGRSEPVDQDIQPALQLVPERGEGPDPHAKLGSGHGGQFLKPRDPALPFELDGGSQAGKACMDALLPEGRHDARRVEADEIGLEIDDEHAIGKTIEIELRHRDQKLRKRASGIPSRSTSRA